MVLWSTWLFRYVNYYRYTYTYIYSYTPIYIYSDDQRKNYENTHKKILQHMNKDVVDNTSSRVNAEKLLEDRLIYLRRQFDTMERERMKLIENIKVKKKRNEEAEIVKKLMEVVLDPVVEDLFHEYIRNHDQRKMVMSAASQEDYDKLKVMQIAITEGEIQTQDTKRYTPILLHMLAREKDLYKRDLKRLDKLDNT